jgi:hypothetical protein
LAVELPALLSEPPSEEPLESLLEEGLELLEESAPELFEPVSAALVEEALAEP